MSGIGGGGFFGSGKKETISNVDTDSTSLGGQVQAQDSTTLNALQLGAGATLTVTDQGAIKKALDLTQVVAGGALDYGASLGAAGLDAAERANARAAASYSDTLAAFGRMSDSSRSGFELALDAITQAFGGARDAQADATARVTQAFESRSQLAGQVNVESLVRMVLIGLGLLGAGALYLNARR